MYIQSTTTSSSVFLHFFISLTLCGALVKMDHRSSYLYSCTHTHCDSSLWNIHKHPIRWISCKHSVEIPDWRLESRATWKPKLWADCGLVLSSPHLGAAVNSCWSDWVALLSTQLVICHLRTIVTHFSLLWQDSKCNLVMTWNMFTALVVKPSFIRRSIVVPTLFRYVIVGLLQALSAYSKGKYCSARWTGC